jgi:hypothetical protein
VDPRKEWLPAEVDGLRELVAASAAIRHFDADPDLGRQLASVGARHPDLGAHVDAAAADLEWASAAPWPVR